jgi:hypothetical protein
MANLRVTRTCGAICETKGSKDQRPGKCVLCDREVFPPDRENVGQLHLSRIESDPSLVRLSRRRIAYCARMSSQFGQHIDFRCRHCGARYVVSYTKLPIADSGSAYCECCKRRMFQWNSASQPRYRLTCPSSAGQCIGAFTGLFEGDIANPS